MLFRPQTNGRNSGHYRDKELDQSHHELPALVQVEQLVQQLLGLFRFGRVLDEGFVKLQQQIVLSIQALVDVVHEVEHRLPALYPTPAGSIAFALSLVLWLNSGDSAVR